MLAANGTDDCGLFALYHAASVLTGRPARFEVAPMVKVNSPPAALGVALRQACVDFCHSLLHPEDSDLASTLMNTLSYAVDMFRD